MQLLSEHSKNGGENPRFETREQLQAEGIPLNAEVKSSTNYQSGPFLLFKRAAEKERKEQGLVYNRAEYRAWSPSLVKCHLM